MNQNPTRPQANKEDVSLTSSESYEEAYYLPSDEEVKQAETIFSFGEDKDSNIGTSDLLSEESDCQEDTKEHIIECPPNVTCLSECTKVLPAGIVECNIPQIGVVELELETKRNSVIVLTSTIDAEKYCCDKYYVCGYTSFEDGLSVKEQIEMYINKVIYIKILLNQQDLPLVLSILGDYKDYHLLIEDMDILLYENNYKKAVEDIMDYYMQFAKDNRCFFTSDSTIFCNPQLVGEQRTIIKWHNYPQRKLQVCECPNIIGTLIKTVQELPNNDKVLIVYTSVQQAKQVILNLSESIQKECGIVCLPYNKRNAGDYYAIMDENIPETRKRITFWTVNNYYPQIAGKYHLITISDSTKGNTTLSLKTIFLIYKMIESPQENILSDTIIYNKTLYYAQWEDDYKTLHQRASKIIQLTDAADTLSADDSTLKNIFNLAKTVIKGKAKGKIAGRFAPFPLIRKDIYGKMQISYMNISSMKFRTNLIYQFYSSHGALAVKLKEIYGTSCFTENTTRVEITEKQKKIEKAEKELQKKYRQDDRLSCLEEIEELYESGELNLQLLYKRSKYGNNIQKRTYKEMALLYNYIDTKELVGLMKGLKSCNSISFKNLNNMVIFWALTDDHPFKKDINQAFPIGGKFRNQEIVELLVPIVQYHLHKDWSDKPRKVISFFKNLVNTIRPRTYYIILQDNRLTGHKNRILKDVNNLLQYFIL